MRSQQSLMLGEVDGRRSPRTRPTLDHLLDKWPEGLDVDPPTRQIYGNNVCAHSPIVRVVVPDRADVETLDSFAPNCPAAASTATDDLDSGTTRPKCTAAVSRPQALLAGRPGQLPSEEAKSMVA